MIGFFFFLVKSWDLLNICSSAGQGLMMAISKPPKTMHRLKVLIKTIYTVELSVVVEQITSGGGVT